MHRLKPGRLAATAAFSSFCLLAAAQPAMAWGRTGHAIIANIAEAQLTASALKHARALLAMDGASHLADIASWADENKGLPGSPEHGVRLHFDAPVNTNNCHSHFCVTGGITFYEHQLADPSLPATQRETALKYVVHLIGDVHQPLHCVVTGFSRTPVIFEGRQQTLHKVWDDGIIKEHGGDASQIAQSLLREHANVPLGGTPTDWAVESRDTAQQEIFKDVLAGSSTSVVLPPDYAEKHWPTAARRLIQAGDRLALYLNEALH